MQVIASLQIFNDLNLYTGMHTVSHSRFTVDFTKLLPKYSKFRSKIAKSIVKFTSQIDFLNKAFDSFGLFQFMGQSGLCLQTGF